MHCPHCSAESLTGLKFCKRCGGSLTAAPAPPRRIGTIWALVSAIVSVVVAGLGVTFGVASDLAGRGIKGQDGPIEIIVFGSLIVLFTLVPLMRLLWKVVMLDLETQGKELLPIQSPSLNTASTTNDLERPQLSHAGASVTEHTTRTFEPQHR